MKLGIALLRVSTDKQFHHGDSLDTQKQRVDIVAKQDGTDIVRYFTEHYSGRKTDRAVIDELLEFLDVNSGEIQIVYIVQIDRFTRAGSDMYLFLKKQLYSRGVELRDTIGIIQKPVNTLEHVGFEYDWSVTSPSRTAEVMQAEYANQEVNQILTRTIGQQIKLAQEGYQTRSADLGFRNVKITKTDGRKATIMEPLEPEATWIRTIFELRASGEWADEYICERLNNMGFESRTMHRRDKQTGEVIGLTGRKPLSVKQLQRIIRKPIYCGIRVGKWTHGEPIKTPFDGLISIGLFNKANFGAVVINQDGVKFTIEYGQSRKRNSHRQSLDFIYRHVVMCPECKKPFWASKSKGKSGKYWGYFHCARKHKSITIPQKEFQKTVGSFLDILKAKPGFLGLFKEVVRETWIDKNKSRNIEIKSINAHIENLKLRQSNIIDRLTISNSEIVQRKLEAEIEDIEAAIQSAEKSKPKHDFTEEQIDAYFIKAKDRLEHPRKYIEKALTKTELEKSWQTIFARPPTYTEIDSGTPALTLLYRLNRDFNEDKERLAADLSANWNPFVEELLHMISF